MSPPEQQIQNLATEALAPAFGRHRYRCDVQFIEHQPAAGQCQQLPLQAQAHNGSRRFLQLGLPLLLCPETAKAEAVQEQTRLQIATAQIAGFNQQTTDAGPVIIGRRPGDLPTIKVNSS